MMSRGRYLHYRQSERLLSFGKAERFVAAVATVPAVDERVALRTLVSQPCPPCAAGPGAGGDSGIAKIWTRREISVGSLR
jgi:hypothetical protein